MTAEIIKLPYSVTRGAHSRKPRRSKNGAPEERAAAAAALPATVTELPRTSRGSLLKQEFEAKHEQLDPLARKYIEGYMQALIDRRNKE